MFEAINVKVCQNADVGGEEKTVVFFDVRFTSPVGELITQHADPLYLSAGANDTDIETALAGALAALNNGL